jgi:hypothetical protein
LPSSLERFNSRALEYSSFPPVSVYGTGTPLANQEVFLGSRVSLNPHQPWLQGPIDFQSDPVFYSR